MPEPMQTPICSRASFSRSIQRINAGREAVMDERVKTPRLFRRQPFGDVEIFDFARDLRRETGRVEAADARDPGFARDHIAPRFRDTDSDRGNDAQTGYDYSAP
jgi:hypothetical protein